MQKSDYCKVASCKDIIYTKSSMGYCCKHFSKYKRYGNPLFKKDRMLKPLKDYYWTKVKKTKNCWLWIGASNNDGYGNTHYNKIPISAHRLAYILEYGNIPKHLEIDHLCSVRNCVNPKHLEATTHIINIRRGKTGQYKR